MTDPSQGARGASEEPREPFVSQGDRPDVRLDPDKPLSELRVRDLRDILWGHMGGKSPFFDKSPSWETAHVSGKSEIVDITAKYAIDHKYPFLDGIFKDYAKDARDANWDPATLFGPGPDPRLNQVIQTVMGVSTQVEELANQVAEMKRRLEG